MSEKAQQTLAELEQRIADKWCANCALYPCQYPCWNAKPVGWSTNTHDSRTRVDFLVTLGAFIPKDLRLLDKFGRWRV